MSHLATVMKKDAATIDAVLDRLRAGALAIIPTDNVYGFVANGDRADVVDRIYQLKGRDRSKPLCYYTTREAASRWGKLDARAEKIIALWPAAVSLIVPKKTTVPDYVTSGMDSVLLVCIDAYTEQLAQRADFPLVATSANLAGEPAITDFHAALSQFKDSVDLILEGEASRRGRSSTIVNLTYTPPIIQRQGPVEAEVVREFIPDVIVSAP